MPASQAAINIASISIGNTDWEEYIITSRSCYTSVPENHFMLYTDDVISDVDEALLFASTLMNAGFNTDGSEISVGSVVRCKKYGRVVLGKWLVTIRA